MADVSVKQRGDRRLIVNVLDPLGEQQDDPFDDLNDIQADVLVRGGDAWRPWR